MTRNLLSLLLFLCLSASISTAVADNQGIEVNLNQENSYIDTVNLKDMAEMVVIAKPNDDNQSARISVILKNMTPVNGLLLFKNSYTEKEAKDLKNELCKIEWPSWLKDNSVQASSGLTRNVVFIDHGEDITLPMQLSDVGENGLIIKFVIYAVEIKGRDKNTNRPSKLKIQSQEIFSIKINVELGPDVVFEEFKAGCEAFVQEINKTTFCPGKNGKPHKPDIEGQLQALVDQCSTKIQEVKQFAYDHDQIMNAAIKGTKYEKLSNDIQAAYDAVSGDVAARTKVCKECDVPKPKTCNDCGGIIGKGKGRKCEYGGNHPICPTHRDKKVGVNGHKYHPIPISITWEQARKQLDDIYKKLRHGEMPCSTASNNAKSIYNKADKYAPADPKNKNKADDIYKDIMKKCK
jgi:hypothetical protein